MSAARPVAGYPSQQAAVRALLLEGRSRHEIAEAIGRGLDAVSAVISNLKAKGELPEDFETGARPSHAIHVGKETLRLLAPHAARRKTEPAALARKLLDTIAREGLVNAILDDRVPA